MRIVIDMQGAQSTGSWNRGIGRYTVSLALAIARNCEEGDEIILALNSAFTESLERIRTIFSELLPPENIRVWSVLTPASHLDIANNWRRETGELVREAFLASLDPDIVLISSLFEGLGDDAITSIKKFKTPFLTAVILYDLIPFIHKAPYLENPVVEKWYLEKIDYLKRADLWLAISESSSKEGVECLELPKARCVNISTDADSQFQPLDVNKEHQNEIRIKYNLHRPFIMYTGGIDHRKNIEGLIRAFALLPENLRVGYQLAIVCSVQDHARNLLESLAVNSGLKKNNLILTGYVPEEDLIALYNLCEVFVFPSWHEGFGLPALEAMRCGAPVIAADATSLREVVGLEDALFDPHSDQAIAKLIERVLTDSEFREKLLLHSKCQSKAFSWDKTGKRALEAMRQVKTEIESCRTFEQQKTIRPRLAYVSPLPPVQSGIADYSAELLPALAEHYKIEVIVAQKNVTDLWINGNIPVHSFEWFAENKTKFDRILYHFGNSEFHKHMVGLLKDAPGVVVLHDFYLSGALHYMSVTGYEPDAFEKNLFKSHGYAALIEKKESKKEADLIWKYPCSQFIFEDALGTIVHSDNSARLAHQWFGVSKYSLAVIPHMRKLAVPQDRILVRKKLGLPENGFVVCSFGLLGPTKLNHRLLNAWLGSDMAKTEQCRLVFVGENESGEYGKTIQYLIKNHRFGKSVQITGWVNQETFRSFLSSADIGVQLRTLSRGETSGTVLDCMNYGLATIINANGSMSDINDAATFKLPDDFTDRQLSEALHKLWADTNARSEIGANAKAIILDEHDPKKCADRYADVLERFYAVPRVHQLTKAIADITNVNVNEDELQVLATALASSFPLIKKAKTLLVDVSGMMGGAPEAPDRIAIFGALEQWIKQFPANWRLELVYIHECGSYFYAREFAKKMFGLSAEFLRDERVDFSFGDMLLILAPHLAMQTQTSKIYQTLRSQGVDVRFVVDSLPTTQQILQQSDQKYAVFN